MIQKLSVALALSICIAISSVKALEPDADLVTTTGAPEDTAVAMHITVVNNIDQLRAYHHVTMPVPKGAGFPNTGMNNSAFLWAREQPVSGELRVVGTLDGRVYLFKQEEVPGQVKSCKQVDCKNLDEYGLQPLLQDSELIGQIRAAYPSSDDDPVMNCEREEFILRNLGIPVHFSQPFHDSASPMTTAVLMLANNKVFKLSVTDIQADTPSLTIEPFPDAKHNTCYTPQQAAPLKLASLLEEKEAWEKKKADPSSPQKKQCDRNFTRAPGANITDIKDVSVFPDYATGISLEQPGAGGYVLTVTFDSRNLDKYNKETLSG